MSGGASGGRAAQLAGVAEAELVARWEAGTSAALRLEDGRALRVIFPGVRGPGPGPDFRDAIVEAGGDLLRGDVEVHVRASGWRAHGHHRDAGYAGVVLHVVGANDTGTLSTLHASGRAVPVVVLRVHEAAAPLPGFVPPCVLTVAQGRDAGAVLERLGLRRLRALAARAAPLAASRGAGQALYALILETCGGPANREAFAALARRLPLAALLERADGFPDRELALTAELRGAAAALILRRAGLRPMASPERRLLAAVRLVARLWPDGASGWPVLAAADAPLRTYSVRGGGRGLAIEVSVNAVLPVALAGGLWSEDEALAALRALPSPGTYGRLRRLEGWLHSGETRPFTGALRLQGGLLLHREYCSQGRCGRCPLSG